MEIQQHPFPYIKELESILEIKDFNDIIKIKNAVYAFIPWTIKNNDTSDIKGLYPKLKRKEIGGWCGFHAKFFQKIMQGYKISCEQFNYGLNGFGLTHMANIVTYLDKEYYIDSYFAKHYVNKDGSPISFKELIEVVQSRAFDDIDASYGPVIKDVQRQSGEWSQVTPKSFEKEILKWFEVKDIKRILRKIFGCDDFRILMTIRIPPSVKKEDFYYGNL